MLVHPKTMHIALSTKLKFTFFLFLSFSDHSNVACAKSLEQILIWKQRLRSVQSKQRQNKHDYENIRQFFQDSLNLTPFIFYLSSSCSLILGIYIDANKRSGKNKLNLSDNLSHQRHWSLVNDDNVINNGTIQKSCLKNGANIQSSSVTSLALNKSNHA